MDISGPAPIGGHASLAAQMPTRTPPEVPVVDESRRPDQERTDANTAGRDNDAAQAARDLKAARKDPDVQTGPPPTFDVTLLEVEQDLQATLARLEAARNHDRDTEAVKLPDDNSVDDNGVDDAAAKVSEQVSPAPMAPQAQEPAERVAVAQLDQPYDVPAGQPAA